MRTEPDAGAALAHALHNPLAPEARELAAHVAGAFGASAMAVVHYGSRAQGRWTRRESAFDFFVVVANYAGAYRSLAAASRLTRSPWVAVSLARVLPPNVLALKAHTAIGECTAKVAVFSERDFRRATSRRAADHFALGRLMQRVILAWTRDAAAEQLVVKCIVSARRQTYRWGRTFLPERFDAEAYCRALLTQSLQGEIRPEHADHADQLFTAQRATLIPIYEELLGELCASGALVHDGEGYRLTAPPGRLLRGRARLYFRRSKARNTIRLLKYVALYDGWLDYIVRKVARSSGQQINVSERERRWPLLFGWPKFIRYLRTRPQRRN